MPSWLKSLQRNLTSPYRLRRWLNSRTVGVLLIVALFFVALVVIQPPSARNGSAGAVQTLTPLPGPTRQATLSPEYIANADQTIGLTLVGTLLVVIVVLGVLFFMPRHEPGE